MLVDTLPPYFYIRGMEESFLDVLLWLSKIRASHEAGDEIEARDAAHGFAHDLALFLAYINRTFYRRGTKSIFKEYEEFKIVPAHYGMRYTNWQDMCSQIYQPLEPGQRRFGLNA